MIRKMRGLLALAVVSVFAQGLMNSALAVDAQIQAPIKIGVLKIGSGPFAAYASLVEEAARTSVDILNAEGGALGRKFEVVVQSHSGTPASAVAMSRQSALPWPV